MRWNRTYRYVVRVGRKTQRYYHSCKPCILRMSTTPTQNAPFAVLIASLQSNWTCTTGRQHGLDGKLALSVFPKNTTTKRPILVRALNQQLFDPKPVLCQLSNVAISVNYLTTIRPSGSSNLFWRVLHKIILISSIIAILLQVLPERAWRWDQKIEHKL